MAVILWLASIAIPFAEHLLRGLPSRHETENYVPVTWLSLPASLVIHSEPLDSWNNLIHAKTGKDVDTQIVPSLGNVVESELDDLIINPVRIHLYGHISEGDSPVFCFYDSERDRWFRLAAGELDADARVHLMIGENGAALHLVDLESGDRFQIHEKNWELTPIRPETESPSGI